VGTLFPATGRTVRRGVTLRFSNSCTRVREERLERGARLCVITRWSQDRHSTAHRLAPRLPLSWATPRSPGSAARSCWR